MVGSDHEQVPAEVWQGRKSLDAEERVLIVQSCLLLRKVLHRPRAHRRHPQAGLFGANTQCNTITNSNSKSCMSGST